MFNYWLWTVVPSVSCRCFKHLKLLTNPLTLNSLWGNSILKKRLVNRLHQLPFKQWAKDRQQHEPNWTQTLRQQIEMLNKRERREKNRMMSDLSSCQLFSAFSLGQTHLIVSHRAASQNPWEEPKITANGSLSSRHEKSFQYVKLQYVKTCGGKLIRMNPRWVHMSLAGRQTTGIMLGIYSSLQDSGGYGDVHTSKQWFSCWVVVEHI